MVIKLSEILKKAEIKSSGYAKSWKEEAIFVQTNQSQLDIKKVGTKVGTDIKKVGTDDKKVGTKVGTDINGIALLVYQYFLQKLNSKKDLVTEYINSTALSLYIGKSGNSIRQSIKRMKKANIIKTINIIDGRKGSAQYQIDRNFYKNFKKLNKKDPPINNSNNKKLLLLKEKEEKEKKVKQSEKLAIERKEEPKQRNWSNINIEPLRKYGLNERHLEDIREFNLLDREVVQESIYHFAFALEENKIKYENPIGVLVGRLCKGKGWFEAEYISEKEKSFKQLVLIKKKRKKEKEDLISEYSQMEYEPWKEALTDEEVKGIELGMPETVKKGHSVFRENYWREYFTEKILMPKLREKGLINKEEDHVDLVKK